MRKHNLIFVEMFELQPSIHPNICHLTRANGRKTQLLRISDKEIGYVSPKDKHVFCERMLILFQSSTIILVIQFIQIKYLQMV